MKRQPAGSPEELTTDEAEVERAKLFRELARDHKACLAAAMREIVPYSGEDATTLTTVVLAKCESFEERRISLAVATYGLPRERAREIVSAAVSNLRKEVLTEIVTARAKAARELAIEQTPPPKQRPATVPAVKSF